MLRVVRRWAARVGLLAGAVMLAAGCSGDDDASAETTSASTSSVTSTSDAPSTTAQPPESTISTTPTTTTTTIVPATTARTSNPPVTVFPEGVPPRATFPGDPDEQAVVDAAYANFDALRAASELPSDPELRAVLDTTMADPVAERAIRFLDALVENGERVVASDFSPTFLEVWVDSILVYEGGATFEACGVDSDIRVGMGPDGSEVAVDDDVVSVALTYELVFSDGEWRVSDITRHGQWDGQIGCN